jgi:signal transduction histidine kinase
VNREFRHRREFGDCRYESLSSAVEYVDRARGLQALRGRVTDTAEWLWTSVPVAWRRPGIAVLGALAAGGVGWATSRNPGATPAHIAVPIRVLIIATLIGTGLYAQTDKIQARMGGQLIVVGFVLSLWLLNGSSNRILFSVGMLCAVLGPLAFAYLMLAYPAGRLHSLAERQFVWGSAAFATTLWTVAVLVSRQPPLTGSLARCAPHCPDSVFSLGSRTSTPLALKAPLVLAWLAITCGPPLFLSRRLRSASALLRRALVPVWLMSAANAVLLVAYLVSRAAGLEGAGGLETAYVAVTAAVPLAFLIGLNMERGLMALALAEFVSQLGRHPHADPQALMASALGDRSLRIVYRRVATGAYVDSSGASVDEIPEDRAVTWVERELTALAAVVYDRDLAGQERLVQAAGEAALMRLEKAQLEADLRASTAELAASRVRMAETAHHERQRLERDLHDGVQQQLVGLRIKLDLAVEALRRDPVMGKGVLTSMGNQMDEILDELRLLAHGLYPELLHGHGLAEALRAAARGMPAPAAFRAVGIGRYREDVEVAVYYCCLEALQNIVKHAGPDGAPKLTLWQDGALLCFEVQDSGIGFDAEQRSAGAGLINMRDRIQTVGGTLEIASRTGRGTTVRGSVPIAS